MKSARARWGAGTFLLGPAGPWSEWEARGPRRHIGSQAPPDQRWTLEPGGASLRRRGGHSCPQHPSSITRKCAEPCEASSWLWGWGLSGPEGRGHMVGSGKLHRPLWLTTTAGQSPAREPRGCRPCPLCSAALTRACLSPPRSCCSSFRTCRQPTGAMRTSACCWLRPTA